MLVVLFRSFILCWSEAVRRKRSVLSGGYQVIHCGTALCSTRSALSTNSCCSILLSRSYSTCGPGADTKNTQAWTNNIRHTHKHTHTHTQTHTHTHGDVDASSQRFFETGSMEARHQYQVISKKKWSSYKKECAARSYSQNCRKIEECS